MAKQKQLLARDKNRINNAICGAAPGFFGDDHWDGLHRVKQALDRVCRAKQWPGKCLENYDLVWDIESDGYTLDESGNQTGKNWHITVIDEDGRTGHGIIRASFCGSVKNPSSRYDIVAYMA